jgi:hypothetical protein
VRKAPSMVSALTGVHNPTSLPSYSVRSLRLQRFKKGVVEDLDFLGSLRECGLGINLLRLGYGFHQLFHLGFL